MDWSVERLFFVASVLIIISLLSSKLSGRFGIPALLLFLAVGMLAGSDGFGGISFDNPHLAKTISTGALIFILFSGAIETDWDSVKQVTWSSISLSTLGVLITALLMGFFSYYLFNFSWIESLLFGAIISSTDIAAVFTILRSKKIHLKKNVKSIIEVEAASNDPIAIILTLFFMRMLISPESSVFNLVLLLVSQITIGLAFGWVMGKIIPWLINHFQLEYKGLYPVLFVSLVLFLYSLTTLLGGNGFLSIYVAGLLIGRSEFIHKEDLIRFNDGIAWLAQIIMFITLGLLVFPSQLIGSIGIDLLVALFLIFIARPIAVFISLMFSQFRIKEKMIISWIGLRGAVPIILATYPLTSGLPKAHDIFNLVFFVVLTSIALQGVLIPWVAKWLKN